MESTTYGQPKDGPTEIHGWTNLQQGDFGLTLEDQDLRARAKLQTKNQN